MNSSSEFNKEKTGLNQKESNDILKNIKSKYILQKLFNNLSKMKLLDIIKYNMKIKNRINISIKDYKEYSGIYSTIEIEIKTVNSKYGRFITIFNDKKYYHIYFNDNEEEIKRNYLNKNENVSKIKIIIDYQIKSFKGLFKNCGCIEYIYFKKFIRNNINNMSYMFFECSSLKELNLSNFKTNNVSNMGFMFFRCSSLKELNLSNFNTNKVTDMELMFFQCSSLKKLNLSNFNTNDDTDIRGMFYECTSLEELNLSNFNFNNVNDMRDMFYGCSEQFQNKIKAKYKNIKEEAFKNFY
jgi:surface protein